MSKSKIKVIAIIIVVLMILGIAAGVVGYYSNGFKNWDKFMPGNWFKNPNEVEQPNKVESGSILNVLTNNGVACVSERIAVSDYSIKGIPANADSAYELTATIQPSVAENKNINWTARWSNVSSVWANDKSISDYLIFNKSTTQSGKKVIVTCLQDFGEQITIIASAEADSTKKSLCSVDYAKKIKSIDFNFTYDNQDLSDIVPDSDGVYRLDYKAETKLYNVVATPVYSAYTIDINYSSVVTGTFTDTFGFGAGVTLSKISMAAGIADPIIEPELSNAALRFIKNVKELNNRPGLDILIKNQIELNYNNLTENEKNHSRVVNAYEALINLLEKIEEGNGYGFSDIEEKNQYIDSYFAPPSTHTFMQNNVGISSLESFLQNALACNNPNEGLVEYVIKYSTGAVVYDFKISLGFTSKSLQAVSDIEIDNGEIII
ncbi:MAG TPA: hypothetical protein PLZ09_03070 [Clostridia bacterium]|nr:hypothetical protein [Clostridia bacterium]